MAVAFAARAALRSVPAIAYRPANEISNLACIVFRATAMALIAVKFPTSNDELRATARAAAEATEPWKGPAPPALPLTLFSTPTRRQPPFERPR